MVFKLTNSKPKKIKINLSLPEDILQLIDEDVSQSYMSRSGWVIKASLRYLEERKKEKIDKIVKG